MDAFAAEILPFTSPDPRVRGIRFSHLLAHTSGLPAYLPLYERVLEAERSAGRPLLGTAEGHDRILAELLALPLNSAPGSAWEYSDLGYMLLGRAIEVAGFQSLDRLLKAKLTVPLGMRDTGYLPLSAFSECETGQIVPTGWSEVRGREKAGEVDDENAIYLHRRRVVMTWRYDVKRVVIDPSLLKDDKDMLEDLVAAAFNDAVRKVEATTQEKLGGMTAGMGLPPGFKMPF
mgnify:CR=1 FL=1